MPNEFQDGNDLGADSSDALDLDAAHLDAGNESQITEGADSSAAQGEKTFDPLSIVKDVVAKRDPKADAASPAAGQEEGSQEKPKKPAEDYSDVPFSAHPRFKQLISERRELQKNVEMFRDDATRYRNVQSFLDQQGVNAEEAADALMIAGLLKSNPVEAWQRLRPIVEKLVYAAGEALPPELAQRVQAGEIPHDAALEIARSKAAVQAFETQRTFEEQRRQREAETQRVESLRGAATTWEQDRQTKDPNFQAKVEPLMKELAYLQLQEGKPSTPEGVKAQLDKAYKAVNATLRPVAPAAPAPRRTTPVTGGQVNGAVREQPKSILDIIRANRAS